MNLKRLVAIAAITGLGIALGFGAALAWISIWGWFDPFRPEYDDTWHEFVPVAIAYLLWGLTAIASLVVGWLFSQRWSSSR
jgi:hypothetical protein